MLYSILRCLCYIIFSATENVQEQELVIPLKRSRSSFSHRLRSNYVKADPNDLLTCKALEALQKGNAL